MPSAEELAASLESGETMDDQFLAGHGGKSEFYLWSLFHDKVIDFFDWSLFRTDHEAWGI